MLFRSEREIEMLRKRAGDGDRERVSGASLSAEECQVSPGAGVYVSAVVRPTGMF